VIRAAYWRGIPCVLLEQNIVPGRATNWLSNKAVTVCHSFQASVPASSSGVKHVVTGNPVRKEIIALSKPDSEPELERPDLSGVLATSNTVRTILVLGGSQGAHAVNEMWLECVEQLKAPFASLQILHQTGEDDCDWVRKSYQRLGMSAIAEPFFEFLPTLYLQADLVISRAGATTLAELSCAGIPAVLIPYPVSVGDHQLKNAEYFALAGGCRIVHQPKPEESSTLAKVVASVMSEPLDVMRSAMLSKAKPDAAQKVCDEIELVVEKLGMSGS
jgi:UDP-N-acetylglucosamine--N-acetylmuramyl-(pentapeptide) pyrophosphoryl-undecaprenol N-acetylglucosamine transferase